MRIRLSRRPVGPLCRRLLGQDPGRHRGPARRGPLAQVQPGRGRAGPAGGAGQPDSLQPAGDRGRRGVFDQDVSPSPEGELALVALPTWPRSPSPTPCRVRSGVSWPASSSGRWMPGWRGRPIIRPHRATRSRGPDQFCSLSSSTTRVSATSWLRLSACCEPGIRVEPLDCQERGVRSGGVDPPPVGCRGELQHAAAPPTSELEHRIRPKQNAAARGIGRRSAPPVAQESLGIPGITS